MLFIDNPTRLPILIVEDDVDQLSILAAMLSRDHPGRC